MRLNSVRLESPMSRRSRVLWCGVSALALLVALLLNVASAEAARPRADRVLSDVFEARSFWGKTLENTPRRGYTTDVATIASIRSGFETARGKEVPFRRVCLSIQRHVTDPHGESVIDPQHMFAADEGCVDIDASSGRIARNLSSAYISAVRIPLLHSYSVCPDWPSGDCSFETSPGSRTVRFDAAGRESVRSIPTRSAHATSTAL